MRPGKPLIYGHLNNIPMLGFPGNPVSSMVCAVLFLKPVLASMLGLREIEPKLENGLLGKDLDENDHREEYLRATISIDERGNKNIFSPNVVGQSGTDKPDSVLFTSAPTNIKKNVNKVLEKILLNA